jgi:hypothetical protein
MPFPIHALDNVSLHVPTGSGMSACVTILRAGREANQHADMACTATEVHRILSSACTFVHLLCTKAACVVCSDLQCCYLATSWP